MGNAVSPATRAPAGAIDSYVAELGTDIEYVKSVGHSRFLKSVKGRHRNGPLLVKVFIKPDPALSLRTYHSRLNGERDNLSDIPNVYSYQVFSETEKAGYIIRQWLASSLYDRISTRPFLSTIEKKWIAFQILVGLRDARNRNVPHGDVKSENILVTSFNWVYITDFASNIKPTYLPLDDPADFSFFYDTSGRRTCYVAPERFYEAGGEIDKKKADLEFYKKDGTISEAMDVFAAGCVIAELFMEGTPTFTLSQLFKYRSKELNIEAHLSAIEDPNIKSLVFRMIALEPESRPSFEAALESSRNVVFPDSFYSFFHQYISSLNELSSPSPFSRTTPTPSIGIEARSGNGDGSPIPSDCDRRIESIWTEFSSVMPSLVPEEEGAPTRVPLLSLDQGNPNTLQSVFPVHIYIPQLRSALRKPEDQIPQATATDGAALIVLSLVCANLRYCTIPSSRLRGLDVLLAISQYLTDEAKLDRLIPYVVELTQDGAASVRAAALCTLLQVIMLVSVITPTNAGIFPEYIIPNIKHLATDSDVLVRCTYAQCIVPLADASVRYLEMAQAMKAHGAYKFGNADPSSLDDASYDSSIGDLQAMIQEQLLSLLADRSSIVKRAVLHNTSSLCIFFGRQKANDILLSHMITYLNDRDWLLRYAFFQSIVDVAVCVGGRSLDEYILPLMIQSLSDVEESVVTKVLQSLTALSELGLFQKTRVWELMNATISFLYHPNTWIRQAAASFLVSAAANLPSTDVWCILYPALKYFLRSDITVIKEEAILTALKTPIPRPIFDAVVTWAKRGDKTQVWKGRQNRNGTLSRTEAVRESLANLRRSVSLSIRGTVGKTDDDEQQLQHLHQLGMTAAEEGKLMAMRDHISKLTDSKASRFASRTDLQEPDSLTTIASISLQKLGVIPITVFPGTQTSQPRRTIPLRTSTSGEPSSTPRAQEKPKDVPSLEDLRSKLATIGGSSTSLNSNFSQHERRDSLNAIPTRSPTFDRSPPESVTSGGDLGSYRRRQRLQLSTDSKAPPLVGSIRTNAIGLVEAPAALRVVREDTGTSGRTSPVSQAGTLRGERKPPIIQAISGAGDDTGVYNLLEHMNLESGKEGMQDFGPRVSETPVRRRANVRTPLQSRESGSGKGDVLLVANLTAHAGPVNGLIVSPDHLFFVSCSDDKTVKIWDTARLERNVTSKPRHTYAQHHARVTALCMIERTHCFASAADDGSLHVVRVHVSQSGSLPKYNKISIIREHRIDHPGEYITCLAHYNSETSSNLLYGTTHGSVAVLDLRTMRVLQQLDNPIHFGGIATMCLDKNRTWLVTGTLSGMLVLWDLRFGLLLRSWKVGLALQPGIATRVHACSIHPVQSQWVVVASETRPYPGDTQGTVLVEIWNVETGQLVECLVTREPPKAHHGQDATVVASNTNTFVASTSSTPADAIAMLVHSRGIKGREESLSTTEEIAADRRVWQPDVRALTVGLEFGGQNNAPMLTVREDFVLTGGRYTIPNRRQKAEVGFIITGSEDRKLRLWHLGRVECSVLISGGDSERPPPTFSTIRDLPGDPPHHTETWQNWQETSHDRKKNTFRSRLIGQHQHELLQAHQDCISAVCYIDSPFRGGIISGDRSGYIKIFKVSLGEE